MDSASDTRAIEARDDARSSIFLGATLYSSGSSTPARIRNLSKGGALIEAAALPEVGSIVQLVRGTLIIHGVVIWTASGRGGLKFAGSVDVQQWRASPNVGQQRVDAVVKLVKAGAVPLPVEALGGSPVDPPHVREEIPDDLRRVGDLLEQLGNTLAGDIDVLCRHGTALQNLDIAMQVLTAVKETVTGKGDWQSDDGRLAGLRRSADLALDRQR